MFSLEGHITIITGGAGHLGKEITKAFAKVGSIIYALGRDEEKLAKLEEFNSELPEKRIFPHSLNVLDDEKFDLFVSDVVKKHGKIDCLINNANASKRESWKETDKAAWLNGLDGTLNHYFTCSRSVSKIMLEQQKGVIINNASMMAFLAPNFPMHSVLNNAAAVHHSAAKGAILQLTRHLAALWGPTGVRVNSVSPGYFPQKRGPDRPDYMQELTVRIPMARVGKPEELAGAFVFLASDAASYVTGHNLIVDGGFSAW